MAYADFLSDASDVSPIGSPKLTSSGPNSAPFFEFNTDQGTRYFTPAFASEGGQTVMRDGGEGGAINYDVINPHTAYKPWNNWSNDTYWMPQVDGMQKIKAPWAADLVKDLPYQMGGDYTGGGWMSDKPPAFKTWQREPDEGIGPYLRTIGTFAALAAGAGGISGWAGGAEAMPWGSLDAGPGAIPIEQNVAQQAMQLGAPQMPPAVFDTGGSSMMPTARLAPEVEGWLPTGTTASGGTVFDNPMNVRDLANSAMNMPQGTQQPPVEERGRPFDPNSMNVRPNIKNMIAGALRMPTALSTAAQGATGIPFGALNFAKSIFDVGSGLYGMNREKKMREMAMKAYDPVRELMANPGMVAGLPGYQFGMDQGRLAIQRRMAAQGGGGNEDIALARFTPEYAQNFYQNEIARRAALAQGSGALNLSAGNSANALASSSLGSIGYGLARMGGLQNPNDQIQRFLMKALGIG